MGMASLSLVLLCGLFARSATKYMDFTFDLSNVPAGHVSFKRLGNCSTGTPSYVGLINPATLTHPNKFFLEIGGGAACFNKSSCNDPDLRRWTDIEVFLTEFNNMDQSMFDVLASGAPVPLTSFGALINPGWIPGSVENGVHPLDGVQGAFLPSCTGDINVGRIDADYEGEAFSHHGGMAIRALLTAVQQVKPNLTDFFIYGGSGGGVAAAAWMGPVADTFHQAQVYTLVDSGFHLMPGTDIFNFYYYNVAWSHGPGQQSAKKVYTDFEVPLFDWLDIRSIATQLKRYEGRAKLAYIGCSEDDVVFSDRKKMGKYASSFYDASIGSQVADMWNFLTMTHVCAPAGSIVSWVANCTDHHITRVLGTDWALNNTPTKRPHVKVNDAISAKDFLYNFLSGRPLDPATPTRNRFWYDMREAQVQSAVCNTDVIADSSRTVVLQFVVVAWCLLALTSFSH